MIRARCFWTASDEPADQHDEALEPHARENVLDVRLGAAQHPGWVLGVEFDARVRSVPATLVRILPLMPLQLERCAPVNARARSAPRLGSCFRHQREDESLRRVDLPAGRPALARVALAIEI